MQNNSTVKPEVKVSNADAVFLVTAAIVSIFILLNTVDFVNQLKQVPSPPYGGDFYNGLGGVIHILDGGSLLNSAQMVDQIPWVPWLYHLSIAVFSKISGMGAMEALVKFSIVVELLAMAVVYAFLKELLQSRYLPLLVFPIYFASGIFPIFKYSDFASVLIVPLFAYLLYRFVKNANMQNAAYAGIGLGLAGLSNTQAFFVGFLLLAFTAIVFLMPKIIDFSRKKLTIEPGSANQIKMFGIVFAVGFAIALLFWYRPIFVYHGETPNDIQNITIPDMTDSKLVWESVVGLLNGFFMPYGQFPTVVFTALSLLGLGHIITSRSGTEAKFTIAFVLTGLFSILHPLITMPLLGIHLVNFMMVDKLYPIGSAMLIGFGIIAALAFAKKMSKDKATENAIVIGGMLLLLVIGMSHFSGETYKRQQDQWAAYGKTEIAPYFVELSQWIRSNSNVNDVFLTTNEDGFMMNALTGRKVLSYRRAHASPYINMHERMADAAVIVYGSNNQTREELLGKYEVSYLLWTSNWVLNEFKFDAEGQFAGFFDPLTVPDNASNKQYWDENGVKYIEVNMPLDPAPRDGVPKYDQLVAVPYELSNEPFNPDLYSNFELVKGITYNGQDIFRIYKRK